MQKKQANYCEFKELTHIEKFECKITKLSDSEKTNLNRKKHIEINKFTEDVTSIESDTYYKINVSKKVWNKWKSKGIKATSIKIDDSVNSQKVKFLFAVRNKQEILESNDYDVRFLAKTQYADNNELSSRSETRFGCSGWEECDVFYFSTSTTDTDNWSSQTFSKNETKATTLNKDKYYLIKSQYKPTYISQTIKTTQKLTLADVQKSIIADNILFILDKEQSS